MNSLSLLSSQVEKVIGPTPPPTPRTESFRALRHEHHQFSKDRPYLSSRDQDEAVFSENEDDEDEEEEEEEEDDDDEEDRRRRRRRRHDNYKQQQQQQTELLYAQPRSQSLAERMYIVLLSPWMSLFRWINSTLLASNDWVMACIYDEQGIFSPLQPVRRATAMVLRPFRRGRGRESAYRPRNAKASQCVPPPPPPPPSPPSPLVAPVQDEKQDLAPVLHHARSRSFTPHDSNARVEEILPQRSIRIRLYNEDSVAKVRSSSVKSPTSPSSSLRLTKYPRNSGPPKPLLLGHAAPKTLILDLDETLIHSLAKGGRMTSGHMVEVKLEKQHAILYYVHKRPYCDDFLRKVCKWYNLVVFTASVQEYADPVIDWLEQDRKYFKGRYYRQHCTLRNGAYIKDLSAVEPDLSRVMIIDNSPTSYIFHEDNAIPIEGWINDPTDIDLLHLIPVLDALQYASDVRAFLALRMGETPP